MSVKDRRTKVSRILHNVFDKPNQIYYDPPESKTMAYPAIVYVREKVNTRSADNKKYIVYDRYQVTYIHKDRDDSMIDKLLELEYCEHSRQYKADDLYHDVFTLYIK